MKLLKDCHLDISKLNDVISICIFGSYNEVHWDCKRSDIDIMVLSNNELHWSQEMDIEDYLTAYLSQYFNHDNVHITFLNDFVYPYGEIMICSPNKIVFHPEKYFDYVLGYSTFKRDRENLEIIRDHHLKEAGLL